MDLKKLIFILSGLYLIMGCQSAVNPEDLYGKWKYIKVESPKNPEESLTDEEVAAESPSIEFSKNHDLVISWGGSRLSDGRFRLEGKLIRYTENLEGGKTREFPFLIIKLTDKELVFETMEQQPTRVTALKELP